MSIRFQCPGCLGKIKAPDHVAGKRVKCPQCGEVSRVSAPPLSPPVPPPPTPGEPIAGADRSRSANSDEANAYESPFPKTERSDRAGVVRMGGVISTSIAIYRKHFLYFVLVNLVTIGVGVFWSVWAAGTVFAYAAAVGAVAEGSLAGIVVTIIFYVIYSFMFLITYAWLLAGIVAFVVGAARQSQAVGLNTLFTGVPFAYRFLGLVVLMYLASALVVIPLEVLALLAPNPLVVATGNVVFYLGFYVILFYFSLSPFVVVDQHKGVFESLSLSARYMRGNALTVFFTHLIVMLGVYAIICFSSFTAFLWILPFPFLVQAVIYLRASGQSIAAPADGDFEAAQNA